MSSSSNWGGARVGAGPPVRIFRIQRGSTYKFVEEVDGRTQTRFGTVSSEKDDMGKEYVIVTFVDGRRMKIMPASRVIETERLYRIRLPLHVGAYHFIRASTEQEALDIMEGIVGSPSAEDWEIRRVDDKRSFFHDWMW